MEAAAQIEVKPLLNSGVERNRIFGLYSRALRVHIEAAFGWREEEQRERFETSYQNEEISVIFVAKELAGCFCIRRHPGRLHVALLLLETEFQRRGIGKKIMESIHADAQKTSAKITLSSFKSNASALAFYQSLSYIVLAEDGAFLELGFERGASNKPLNARPRVKHAAH